MGLIICILYTCAGVIKGWGIFTQLRYGEIVTGKITKPPQWLLAIGSIMTIFYVLVGDLLMVSPSLLSIMSHVN